MPLSVKPNLLQFGTIPTCADVGIETLFPIVIVIVASLVSVPTTPHIPRPSPKETSNPSRRMVGLGYK